MIAFIVRLGYKHIAPPAPSKIKNNKYKTTIIPATLKLKKFSCMKLYLVLRLMPRASSTFARPI